MDAKFIEALLQRASKRRYRGKVGESVRLDLPPIPFTRDTEFLVLKIEKAGDAIEEPHLVEGEGEGELLPRQIISKAVAPGRSHVFVHAYDSEAESELAGVAPLEFIIDIDNGS